MNEFDKANLERATNEIKIRLGEVRGEKERGVLKWWKFEEIAVIILKSSLSDGDQLAAMRELVTVCSGKDFFPNREKHYFLRR